MSHADRAYFSPQAAERFKAIEKQVRRAALYQRPHRTYGTSDIFYNFITLPAANRLTMSPLFGAWLDRVMRAEEAAKKGEKGADILAKKRAQYIGNYAVTAAIWGEHTLETRARLEKGYVMIPEIGRVAMRGVQDSLVRVEVEDGIRVLANNASVHIPQDAFEQESELWQPLRYIGPDDFRIALNDIDPNRSVFRYDVSPRLTDAEYNIWSNTFNEAWELLQTYDPHLASIARAHLTTIIPAPTEALTHSKTMAAGASIGAIAFNENRDPHRLLSQIAFGLRKDMALALRTEYESIYPEKNMYDPVYPPSREGYGIAAHLQDDTFINIGLARFFRSLLERGDPALRDYYELSFARWYTESQQNIAAWKKSAYQHQGNGWLLNTLSYELRDLEQRYSTLPEAAKQKAAVNAQDRYSNWRLSNITLHQSVIHYLRDKWYQREVCPPLAVAGRISTTNDAYVHIGQRTRYVLTEVALKEPQWFAGIKQGTYNRALFGKPTPGDVAFASGNIREARQYFAAAVREQPNNTEAWAGYAATFAQDQSYAGAVFNAQPELVAALYTAIGDSALNPAALAAWLAPCKVTVTHEGQMVLGLN